MSLTQSRSSLVERRAELMAELFLEDLQPEFLARPNLDFGYDFVVVIKNVRGGFNTVRAQIKATDQPVKAHYRIRRREYENWANSNIPVLVLVIDVKRNVLYLGWPKPEDLEGSKAYTIAMPLTEIDDTIKAEIRERLTR